MRTPSPFRQLAPLLLIAASLTMAACGRSAASVDPSGEEDSLPTEATPVLTATDVPLPPAHPASVTWLRELRISGWLKWLRVR